VRGRRRITCIILWIIRPTPLDLNCPKITGGIGLISFHAVARFNLGLSWAVGPGRTGPSQEPLKGVETSIDEDVIVHSPCLHRWLARTCLVRRLLQ
jgi:hypothetical protein